MDKENEASEVKKNDITLGLIIGWLLGGMFFISAISSIFSEPLTSFYAFLSSIVLLPPANKFIKDKFGFSMSSGVKFVLVIILLGLLSNSLPKKEINNTAINRNSSAITNAKPVIPQKETINVTAYKLYGDYEANEVSADAKYKDKILMVSGTIDSIGKDVLNTPYVTLKGQEYFGFIQCMFSKNDESKLVNLSKGQSIVLRGENSSKVITNVLISNCSIVK